MEQIIASEHVRLQVDVPELELRTGEVGLVVSTWFHPNTAYEVEFSAKANICTRRVLLLRNQIAREQERQTSQPTIQHCIVEAILNGDRS